jgi:ATP-dependent DNA helicase 2 subunit 1
VDLAVIKFLGFKDESELAFEDNVKHSFFIYPDEMVRSPPKKTTDFSPRLIFTIKAYSGSKRTFNALLKSMIQKHKIGIALALTRRNSSPTFCAVLPQVS